MVKLLWMTIDRHPASLRGLIREELSLTDWETFEASYDSLEEMESVPLEEIDAVLLAPARHFPIKYMDRLRRCKIMQVWSSGYDKFNLHDARERQIFVANNYGANALSVAEHAILMMLGIARRAPEMHNRVISGNWDGNDHGMTSYSLSGKTLGVVGLGNIGRLVAERAEAFGMRIVFSDPEVDRPVAREWTKVSFNDLLAEADFVSFHVHLQASTRHLINFDNLSFLKRKKPFLINVSRADLIEREALNYALESSLIRGVAIDAHYEEPTNTSDKLMNYPNVFFSPHVAGSTIDSYQDMIKACVENISSFLETGAARGGILL